MTAGFSDSSADGSSCISFVFILSYNSALSFVHSSRTFFLLCSGFEADLRRSPRLKTFARRHSNTFYSSSQAHSRNLDRALSASQLSLSGVNMKTVRSPLRILFGAAESPRRSSEPLQPTRAPRSRLSTDSSVFEVSSVLFCFLFSD